MVDIHPFELPPNMLDGIGAVHLRCVLLSRLTLPVVGFYCLFVLGVFAVAAAKALFSVYRKGVSLYLNSITCHMQPLLFVLSSWEE